ncbi:MAG: hypothetical protein QM795_16965 [Pseudoxanthomonas sp.]
MELFRLLILIPVALMFGLAGAALLFLPPGTLLKWDRRTGYWLFHRASSPQRGLLAAGLFYKALGTVLLAVVVLKVLPDIFN